MISARSLEPRESITFDVFADQWFQYGATHPDSDNASVIFVEVHRDIGFQHDLAHTIAHEMSHSGSGQSEVQDHDEFGLMSEGAPDYECCFSATTLLRMRGVVKW